MIGPLPYTARVAEKLVAAKGYCMRVGSVYFRQAIIDDAPDLARILIGANEATFRGLVPDKCLTSLSHEESVANWRRTLSAGGLADGNFLIVCEYAVTEPAGVETGRRELVGYVWPAVRPNWMPTSASSMC